MLVTGSVTPPFPFLRHVLDTDREASGVETRTVGSLWFRPDPVGRGRRGSDPGGCGESKDPGGGGTGR